MTHVFVCREYPPAAYLPGGIGTYLHHIAPLLAEAGETVHVIAHRWSGAPHAREVFHGGRLIVHRVALDEPISGPSASNRASGAAILRGMLASSFPSQAFSWQAALLAERLIEQEGIDVIEGQEWEAPLYYLQLRRALNLGPARRPRCIVHLHSPTELIFAANGWDTTVADYGPAVAMETYSIERADAILCPSRYLADQAVARYRIDPSRLTVIPYPRGDFPRLERRTDTWSTDAICYLGRLEPRKGVLEWARAFAAMATEYPSAAMEFVGGDMPLGVAGGESVCDAMRASVPRGVWRRFRFHGSQDRAGMSRVLSRACAAVVPSRWENFPYTCIEAMSSGLPIIASPMGGMRELVTDGVSGWIATDASPEGLAGALRRMLETPAAERERMGHAAAEAVRRVCDNQTIVARHLAVKAALVQRHASDTTTVAPADSSASAGGVNPPASEPRAGRPRRMGIIVSGPPNRPSLAACLSSLRSQTAPPDAVRVVGDGQPGEEATVAGIEGWEVVRHGGQSVHDAAMAAAESLARTESALDALVFVDSCVRLEPAALSLCDAVFGQDRRVGLVSGWLDIATSPGHVHIPPCPIGPHLWQDDGLVPFVAVRIDAFREAMQDSGGPVWAPARGISDRLTALGWTAVTFPAVLGAMDGRPDADAFRRPGLRFSSIARAVQRLHTPPWRWLLDASPAERRALLRGALRHPARSAHWLVARLVGRRWLSPLPGPTDPSPQFEALSPEPSCKHRGLAYRPRGTPPRPPR